MVAVWYYEGVSDRTFGVDRITGFVGFWDLGQCDRK